MRWLSCLRRGPAHIAEGSPPQLKSRLGGDRIDIVLHDPGQLTAAAAVVARAVGAAPAIDPDARSISVPVADRMAALADVLRQLDDAGIAAEDIAVRRPTLDEVFLHLTGHGGSRSEKTEVAV